MCPAMDEVFTKWPPSPWLFKRSTKVLMPLTTPLMLTPNTQSQSS